MISGNSVEINFAVAFRWEKLDYVEVNHQCRRNFVWHVIKAQTSNNLRQNRVLSRKYCTYVERNCLFHLGRFGQN